MGYDEAFRLTLQLAGDPSSHVAAAVAGWTSASSAEALVLADLYDLQHRSKSRSRPKPYPRPWDGKSRTKHGGGTGLTAEQYRAIRAKHMDN